MRARRSPCRCCLDCATETRDVFFCSLYLMREVRQGSQKKNGTNEERECIHCSVERLVGYRRVCQREIPNLRSAIRTLIPISRQPFISPTYHIPISRQTAIATRTTVATLQKLPTDAPESTPRLERRWGTPPLCMPRSSLSIRWPWARSRQSPEKYMLRRFRTSLDCVSFGT